MNHLNTKQLEAGLDVIRQSPKDNGKVELIVRRLQEGEREILQVGQLDTAEGLIGDTWKTRTSSKTEDGSAHPDMQINIMNSRTISLLAQDKDRWPLAGDQFFIDMDLSDENLPPKIQLALGSAILEVTEIPHTGCSKFNERFGPDALRFVNSSVGIQLNLRGINAKVVLSGEVQIGDVIKRL